MKLHTFATALAVSPLALSFSHGEAVAPDSGIAEVRVAEGAIQTEAGPVTLSPTSDGIQKTGSGEYVLPISAFAQQDAAEVTVREGTFTLSDTGAAAVAVPAPACLQKAALWLDAAQGVVSENGAVSKWLDVREGATDNGAYYCAGGGVSPATATSDGKTWIDFGGAGSGKWLSLQNTSRSALKLSTVYHAYAVLDTTSAYGFVFGVQQNSPPTFHPGDFSGNAAGHYWSRGDCSTPLYAGSTYLDGAWIDGTATDVKTGVHLLEWAAGNETALVHYFFKDRNLSDRMGGAMLGEVALFTNRLDSVERMAVEQYLLRKWRGEVRPAAYAAKTAPETTAAFDGLAQEDFDKVSVTGLGKAEKRGADAVAWRDAGREPFGGAWHIVQGAMAFESGETPLAFGDGDTLSVAKDGYGVATYTHSSGTAGAVSVSGGGALRVASLPAATTAFSVSADGLSLASANAKAPGTVRFGDAIYATIPNADFEAWTSTQWQGSDWTSQNWSFAPNGGVVMVARTGSKQWTDYVKLPTPTVGKNILCLRPPKSLTDVATASTTVTFPASGRYEFTFNAYGRAGQDGAPTDFSLVKDGGEIRFARLHGIAWSEGMRNERFLTPEVEAGTYTLKLTVRNHTTSEKWTFFDDLKMRLVTDIPSETVFNVPNGGFEISDLSEFRSMSAANTAQGWTFSNPTGGDPDAGVAARCMTTLNRFNAASAVRGNIALAFFGNAGSATSDTFPLPAGKWRLRFRAGRWGSTSTDNGWHGKRIASNPAVAATATVDGTPVSLGSTSLISDNVFKSFVLPNAIESDGTAQVSLAIRQTETHATYAVGLLVDDLELVRDDNLVVNGNFEDASGSNNSNGATNGGWLLEWDRSNGSTTAKAELTSPLSSVLGRTACEGSRALYIVDCGSASRSVSFPEAGLYRLSFRARSRADYVNNGGGDLPTMQYGGNAVKALLDGSEIYRTPAIGTTNFVYFSGLFRVAAAGSKTFTLQGCAASGDKNCFVDLVSIEKTDVGDVPDIAAETEIEATLTDGAKLRLDYPGTLELARLRVNGKNLWNEISAETYPNYIAGPGKAFTKPFSTVIYMR